MMPPTPKTAKDCAACPHVSKCDAHISGGTHSHEESGCQPIVTAEAMDAGSRRFCDSVSRLCAKRLLEADPETISLFGRRAGLSQRDTEILKLMEEETAKKIIDADKENARIINSGAYHPKAVR